MEEFLTAYWAVLAGMGTFVGMGVALGLFHASTLRTGRRAHQENVRDLQELQGMLREDSVNRQNRRGSALWTRTPAQIRGSIERYGTPLRPEKR